MTASAAVNEEKSNAAVSASAIVVIKGTSCMLAAAGP
jgi:hypothetical protein